MNDMKTRLVYTLVLCAVFFPSAAWASVHTQAPAVIDLEIQPRDIIEEKIVLENTSDAKVTLFASVNEVIGGLEGGVQEQVSPSMTDRSRTLVSWIEMPRTVELNPREKREIPLIIRVGPTAEGGDYHAMISFAPGSTFDDARRIIDAGGAPRTFLNATLEIKKHEGAGLSRFTVKRFITAFRDTDVRFRVANTGDTEIRPDGEIIVYNQRGEEVTSVPVNPDGRTVAPGSDVEFSTGIPPDNLLGKYKAYLNVRYGSGQAAVYDTVFFYAIPLKKVIIAFVSFLALALMCALWIHRRLSRRRYDDYDMHDTPAEAQRVTVVVRDGVSRAHPKDVIMKK